MASWYCGSRRAAVPDLWSTVRCRLQMVQFHHCLSATLGCRLSSLPRTGTLGSSAAGDAESTGDAAYKQRKDFAARHGLRARRLCLQKKYQSGKRNKLYTRAASKRSHRAEMCPQHQSEFEACLAGAGRGRTQRGCRSSE